MGHRAESLADRIEKGAVGLAEFAEGLSDAEWRTPMSSGKDRRPVGVVERPRRHYWLHGKVSSSVW